MASAAETTPGEPYGAGSADGDPPVRMSPEAQAELRVRIAHQVASALQDPRRDRGHDASASDGSWFSILTYTGIPVGGGPHVEPTPPPIRPGVLPEVLLSDFDPYLRRIRPPGVGGGERAGPRPSDDETDAFAETSAEEPDETRARDEAGFSSLASEEEAAIAAAAAASDDQLRAVPPAFFEAAFELSDPATFAAVCGNAHAPDATHVSVAARARLARADFRDDATTLGPPRVARAAAEDAAATRLQDTLGKHLDAVETRLTRAVQRRGADFTRAADQIDQLVCAVERARVTCASARGRTRNAAARSKTALGELTALRRLRSNLGSVERACVVLAELRDARADLAQFVEAEEHAGALEAAEEVRAIQKNPLLSGIACAGEALTRHVAEIEWLCGAAVARQWRDCALVPRGATAQRGGGAPAPESCFAIVGAAARDAGLSPPPAGEWERTWARRGGSDDDAFERGDVSFLAPLAKKDVFWGESRGGLGPDERTFADAAQNVYPRLTRALRASCVGEASNASVSAGGVAGDAMRLWSDAAAKDVAAAMRRAARAALIAAGAGGDAFESAGAGETGEKGGRASPSLPEALAGLPESVLARVLETAAAAAREHFARAAMCATWTRRALGVGDVSRTASAIPRAVSAASAASTASSTEPEAEDGGLETAFGFETFDADGADDDAARPANAVAACSVVLAASEAASRTPARRRAAIASAAADAARRVADAAQKTFADFLVGFESARPNRVDPRFRNARRDDDAADAFAAASRDHFASADVCEAFARAAETLGRRRCLALRSAATRRSARWLARFAADATEALSAALETETWAVPDDGDDDDEAAPPVVASARFLSRITAEALRLARREPALAADVARRLSELVRLYNARSCRLVLGAEATRNALRLKSITAKHLAATHASLRFAAEAVLLAARGEIAPLVPPARREAWEREAAKTARDLDAHCAEIRAKLVAIMRERCEARCAEIRVFAGTAARTDAERAEDAEDAERETAPSDSGDSGSARARVFSATAEAAARELETIGRVVGARLDGAERDEVFGEIAAVFDAGFATALASSVPEANAEESAERGAAARGLAAALAWLTTRDAREAAPALACLGATVAEETETAEDAVFRRFSAAASSSS